jgi:hypothetical protein
MYVCVTCMSGRERGTRQYVKHSHALTHSLTTHINCVCVYMGAYVSACVQMVRTVRMKKVKQTVDKSVAARMARDPPRSPPPPPPPNTHTHMSTLIYTGTENRPLFPPSADRGAAVTPSLSLSRSAYRSCVPVSVHLPISLCLCLCVCVYSIGPSLAMRVGRGLALIQPPPTWENPFRSS